VTHLLDYVADLTRITSASLKSCYSQTRDQRALRAELMLEELSEALTALATCDEVELADALADLSYVVTGTATTYDIPLSYVLEEVHRSNMSKTRTAADHQGDKGKGELYSPPKVAIAIHIGRAFRLA